VSLRLRNISWPDSLSARLGGSCGWNALVKESKCVGSGSSSGHPIPRDAAHDVVCFEHLAKRSIELRGTFHRLEKIYISHRRLGKRTVAPWTIYANSHRQLA
jgi:hypothetical protein